MVAAISVTNQPNSRETTRGVYYHHHHHSHNVSRPPLLPSERENGVVTRRPKSREVTSRYLSSSISTTSTTSTSSPSSSSSSSSASSYNSKRCPSPLLSRTAPSLNPSSPLFQKRSQSVERKRSTVITTPRPITPLPNNAGGDVSVVVTSSKFTSTRSLSVSFQGESFSLPICKTKSVPPPTNSRKVTPERRRATPLRGGGGGGGGGGGAKVDGGGGGGDQMENSKKFDQLRWPGRSRQVNPLTKSMDSTGEKKKVVGSGMGVPALQQSMVIDEGTRASIDECRLQNDAELGNSVQVSFDAVSVHSSSSGSPVPTVLNASDTESVSSGSNSSLQEFVGITRAHSIPDGISVPARFWQETNSRMRRLHDLSSPLSKMIDSRTMAPPKLIPSKKVFMDNPVSSPRTVSASRALSSPLRGGPIRPLSPSKLMVSSAPSPSRGMPSPSRGQSPSKMRNSMVGPLSTQLNNTPSILSFASDVRRGKMGENRIADAHLLRLLYNRHLQWRFVNARSDFAVFVQSLTAEKNLYNAWVTTSELRRSVTLRRIKLQLLRQSLKISSMLKGQMTYLEEWVLLERDHSSSLSGAIESLKASTLRLPVVGGARAEILNVKDAVGSAVDVMQAMASSICSLLPKVEEVNALVAELANVSALEKNLLDQCRDLLSTLAAMQINHCSLRTHKLQLERIPSTKSLTMQV